MQGQVMHGQIGSSLESCADINAQSGVGQKGGVNVGPFGQHMQTAGDLVGVTTTGLAESLSASGKIETPLDGTTSIGVSGNAGGGMGTKDSAGIATPFVVPFGRK